MKIGKTTPTGVRTFMVLGGDYITRGRGGGKKSYKGWSKGPLFNFLKSKFDSGN